MAREWNDRRDDMHEGRGRYRGRAYSRDRRGMYHPSEYLSAYGEEYFPYGGNLEPIEDHFYGRRPGWAPSPDWQQRSPQYPGFQGGPMQGQQPRHWPGDNERYHDYFRERQLREREREQHRGGYGNYNNRRGDFRSSLPVPYRQNFGPNAEYHDYGGQDAGFYDEEGRGLGLRRYNRYKLPVQ